MTTTKAIDIVEQKAREALRQDAENGFIKVYFKTIDNYIKLKEGLSLYLYMTKWATRGLKKSQRSKFWNEQVFPYGLQGYIPFAKHQSFIAKHLEVNQSTISRRLKVLEDLGAIKIIGYEFYPEKDKPIPIYAIGVWTKEKGTGSRIERLFVDFI